MENRHLFTIMATPIEVPVAVDRHHWPVHVTLVGNFRADRSQFDAISASLIEIVEATSAFGVVLGPAAQFGATHSIPVLLAEHPDFHRLHQSLAARVMQMTTFEAVEPAFWGSGYRPHATLAPAVRVEAGDVLQLNNVALISLDGQTGRRLSTVSVDP
ncbi:2'-5' RNA ligase family protein [Microbacterium timonense]|uniref:2'-5' RNA ligase family protein n=1 Tax=Microbacterium timonense TaxID=2086576 RepID=UPI00135704E2|nr:2'-5' RNA ligase family protein [Microbacterium timonense]